MAGVFWGCLGPLQSCLDDLRRGGTRVGTITTSDGTEIFYKDWGEGEPIVFSHGWPLSADDWDTQMLFFLEHGYRVIAHDRRGHGRSSQTGDGHDMDHYADDMAALTDHLDLRNAVQGGADQRGAAAHGPDRRQPAGHAEERVRRLPGSARREPLGVLPGRVVGALLRLQPTRRRPLGGDHPQLVAPGDDGWREGALRRHRRLLADGLHRGPQADQRPGPRDAQPRRPDRSLQGIGSAGGRALAERDAQDLRGVSARHADDRGLHDQRRPAGVPAGRGSDRAAGTVGCGTGLTSPRGPARPSWTRYPRVVLTRTA